MGAHQVFGTFVVAASVRDARSEVNWVSARVPNVRNASGFVLSELPNTCSRTHVSDQARAFEHSFLRR